MSSTDTKTTTPEIVAVPSEWACAYGQYDDEPFCQEVAEEDGGHNADQCPTIHVTADDADKVSALVDEVNALRLELSGARRAALKEVEESLTFFLRPGTPRAQGLAFAIGAVQQMAKGAPATATPTA